MSIPKTVNHMISSHTLHFATNSHWKKKSMLYVFYFGYVVTTFSLLDLHKILVCFFIVFF